MGTRARTTWTNREAEGGGREDDSARRSAASELGRGRRERTGEEGVTVWRPRLDEAIVRQVRRYSPRRLASEEESQSIALPQGTQRSHMPNGTFAAVS